MAYLPAAGLTLLFCLAAVFADADSAMLVGLLGLLLVGYLLALCIVSGVMAVTRSHSFMLFAAINACVIALGCVIAMRELSGLFLGLAAGVLTIASSGITMLVRHFLIR